jgi:hypothetical protein
VHVGRGNKKIATTVGIFDLPVMTTCPGAGDCIHYCYAMKAEWWGRGRPTLKRRIENLTETYKTTFVADMVRRIKEDEIRIFRPQESGDFLDQPYVDKWIEIAEECPETTFYAYTKSLHLNLSHFPSNFTLIFSKGGKYDKKIRMSRHNYARVDEINDKTIGKGEFVCPEVRSSGKRTEKYCAYNCNYCLTSKGYGVLSNRHQIRVVFHKSMGGWIGIRLAPRPSGALIRPLLPLPAQSQKPTQPTRGPAGAALPKKGKAGEARAASEAEIANAVEAELAYRHLLLAGFTEHDILHLTGVKDRSELRREHALKLIKQKAAAEESRAQVKLLHQKRHKPT